MLWIYLCFLQHNFYNRFKFIPLRLVEGGFCDSYRIRLLLLMLLLLTDGFPCQCFYNVIILRKLGGVTKANGWIPVAILDYYNWKLVWNYDVLLSISSLHFDFNFVFLDRPGPVWQENNPTKSIIYETRFLDESVRIVHWLCIGYFFIFVIHF